MKTHLKLSICCIAFLFLSIQIFGQNTYKLSYKYEKGKVYFINTVSSSDMVTSYQGQDINMKSESKSKTKMEVTDASADKFEVITTMESFFNKMTDPMGGEDRIDSGKTFVGRKTKINYANTGTVIQITALTTDPNQAVRNQAAGVATIIKLPDNEIKVGDSWTNADSTKTTLDNGGEMKVVSSFLYKLESKEKYEGKDCLKISCVSKTKNNGSVMQGENNMVVEGNSKTSATYFMDLESGMIISAELISETISNTILPDRGVNYESNSKYKTNITLTDK